MSARGMRQLVATISHAIKAGIVERSRFSGTTAEVQATMLDDDDVEAHLHLAPCGG